MCEKEYIVHLQLPIPSTYITSFFEQSRPNHAAVIMRSDGRTLVQTQPFQVCRGDLRQLDCENLEVLRVNRVLRIDDLDIYGTGNTVCMAALD